jgi:hypothetical protein
MRTSSIRVRKNEMSSPLTLQIRNAGEKPLHMRGN